MAPALIPRDRLLVFAYPRHWLSGEIVVLRNPEDESRFLVKRVAEALPNGYLVVGDNRTVSRDGRHFGLVTSEQIIGRAVFRYLPAERRGRLAVRLPAGGCQRPSAGRPSQPG